MFISTLIEYSKRTLGFYSMYQQSQLGVTQNSNKDLLICIGLELITKFQSLDRQLKVCNIQNCLIQYLTTVQRDQYNGTISGTIVIPILTIYWVSGDKQQRRNCQRKQSPGFLWAVEILFQQLSSNSPCDWT